jgi:hypothetical protein
MIKFCNTLVLRSILYFIFCEIKIFFKYFKYFINFFRYVSFFKYLRYRKKDYRILRNSAQKETLKTNYSFWKTSLKKKDAQDSILITSLVDVLDYGIGNAMIGKSLSKILNTSSVALIQELHFKTEIFIRSFGIDKIYYVPEGNIFSRFKFLFKSIGLINDTRKTDDLLKLKYHNIDVGIATYDHHIRYTGVGSCDLVNAKMIYFLSKALMVQDFSENLFKSNSFKEVIQSESQFIPPQIIFQNALINNCKVFARVAPGNKISVMIYDNYKDRYRDRYSFSKELLNLVHKNFDKNKSKQVEDYMAERFKGNPAFSVDHNIAEDKLSNFEEEKNLVNNYTKSVLCKKFSWDINKPIVVIFANDMTDGVFKVDWKIFKDNWTGFLKTIEIIKEVKNINWIIKSHPNDIKTKIASETEKEVLNLPKQYNHIRLFPKNFGKGPLPKIISAAITMSGSVGYEYPSLGIPSIVCAGTFYAGHGFTHEIRTINDYKEILTCVDKLPPLSDEQVSKAKTFVYIQNILSKNTSSFIPESGKEKISKGYEDINFWKNFEVLIDNYNFNEDYFYNNFKVQIEKNDRHTINYKFLH